MWKVVAVTLTGHNGSMTDILPSVLAHLQTLKGKRIRLIRCTDPYTKLAPGEEGVVTLVDDFGTVHVKWDCGSSLGLIYREDVWEEVAS